MSELLTPWRKTYTLPNIDAPGARMARSAPVENIWQLQYRAADELLAEMQEVGIPADETWIRSTVHRIGGHVDTVLAVGLLTPGAPARFLDGPLDGTTQPSQGEPRGGRLPRLTRADGSFYELADINYLTAEYVYLWHPADKEPFIWG